MGDSEKDKYSIEVWNYIFKSNEIAKSVYDEIERTTERIHSKGRYARIALAYKNFINHEDIQSFLCVLTKHPKKGDGDLDLCILEEIFQYLCHEKTANIDYKETFYLLDGDEYDNKKEEIIQKLSSGKKIFVISVYQTIGAGQNLQYRIPANLSDELIQTNDRLSRGEKDFDAIYLDKPTNLLVNLMNNSITEEEFIKYLFHTEFLQETSEISTSDTFSHVKKVFRFYISGYNDNKQFAINLYNCKSVTMFSARVIIQAVGRICAPIRNEKISTFLQTVVLQTV